MDWSEHQKELTEVAGALPWDQVTAIADMASSLLARHGGTMTLEHMATATKEVLTAVAGGDTPHGHSAFKRLTEHTTAQGATVAALQEKVAELEESLAYAREVSASLEKSLAARRLEVDGCRQRVSMREQERDALRAEVERLKAKLTGAGGRAKLLLDAKNHWAERARAAETSQHALLAAGGEFQQRMQALEADRDGWRLVAIRALVLNVIVRAQWERYVDAAGRPVDGCPGPGKCHGSLSWCDRCGDVGLLCDMHGRCDLHRDRWLEHVLEHAPVAKIARDEGHAAGRMEARSEASKEIDELRSRLRRSRTDAWAEAVDVINGELLASAEAREALAPVMGRIVPKQSPCGCDAVFFEGRWKYHRSECPESFDSRREREQAVRPFFQFARDRIARRSYEPIPLEACRRLLAAYNESPEEEAENG